MEAKRVARLIQWEMARANDEQMDEILHSAEHLIKVCIDGPTSPDEIVHFEELLQDVQGRTNARANNSMAL
jgi:hypothetical protein